MGATATSPTIAVIPNAYAILLFNEDVGDEESATGVFSTFISPIPPLPYFASLSDETEPPPCPFNIRNALGSRSGSESFSINEESPLVLLSNPIWYEIMYANVKPIPLRYHFHRVPSYLRRL